MESYLIISDSKKYIEGDHINDTGGIFGKNEFRR